MDIDNICIALQKSNNKFEDQIEFFIHLLLKNNIELYWTKHEYISQGNLIEKYMITNCFKEY